MSDKTLREVLADAVEELGEPTFALFTTFNFDPSFFEDHVLPVFSEGLDASTLPGVLDADRFLRSMRTVVFHDADQLAHGRKRLSYGAVAVRPKAHNYFHPKLILLGDDNGEFQLIVTSANLTVSGWGRNEEVVVGPVGVPGKSALSRTLFLTLEWLREYAAESLKDLDQEAAWYASLCEAITQLETIRRVNPSETLLSTLANERDGAFVDGLIELAEEINARRLTVYSPYFTGELSGLVAKLKDELGREDLDVRIVPALERTADDRLRVGICTSELARDRNYTVHRVKGDEGARFRHGKLLWLEGSWKRHALVVGSHNFTKPALATGLGTRLPNVEASIVLRDGEKQTLAWLGELADLEVLELANVETKTPEELEGEAPSITTFTCSVLADWKRREYRIGVSPSDTAVTVDLPGVSPVNVEAGQAITPFAAETDAALRKRKNFRAWNTQEGARPQVGLICEVGWELFRQDGIGRSLADYIDVWRARDLDELKERSRSKTLRLPLDPDAYVDDDADALAALAEKLDRQDHLDNLYGILGGLVELRKRLSQADSGEDVTDLLFSGPHSLSNFVQILDGLPETEISPIRRWVYYTEAVETLRHSNLESVDEVVTQRLEGLVRGLEMKCEEIERETTLHELDQARFPDKRRLFAWFRSQLEKANVEEVSQ